MFNLVYLHGLSGAMQSASDRVLFPCVLPGSPSSSSELLEVLFRDAAVSHTLKDSRGFGSVVRRQRTRSV